MVSPDELTEEQMNKLLNNPEVVKTIDYEEMGVFELSEQLSEMQDSENFGLFVESVAERSGRVTEATVRKVVKGMIEEAEDYNTEDSDESEDTEDTEESEDSDE